MSLKAADCYYNHFRCQVTKLSLLQAFCVTAWMCKSANVCFAHGMRFVCPTQVLINAGQANAATGDAGYQDCLKSAEAVAQELGIDTDQVLIESTGVALIGKHSHDMTTPATIVIVGIMPPSPAAVLPGYQAWLFDQLNLHSGIWCCPAGCSCHIQLVCGCHPRTYISLLMLKTLLLLFHPSSCYYASLDMPSTALQV